MNPPPAFLSRFGCILSGLCDVLAARAARVENPASLMLVWRWVQRLQGRAERLARRAADGEAACPEPPAPDRKLKKPPVERKPHGDSAGEQPPDAKPLGPRLPLQFGWIVRQDPDTLPFGTELLALLLYEPEMQAFLEAAPEIVPPIRHLLRLLAICPPWSLARRIRGPAAGRTADRERMGPIRHRRRPQSPGATAPAVTDSCFVARRVTLSMINGPWKPV